MIPEGFRPIGEAPRVAIEVELWHEEWSGIRVGHFAHGGGEEQPPFGPAYFYRAGRDYFREFYPQPTHFRPIEKERTA